MEEIFYKNIFGPFTITISVLRKEDDSYSFSIAKYMDQSKSNFIGHFQFSMPKNELKNLIEKLNEEIDG